MATKVKKTTEKLNGFKNSGNQKPSKTYLAMVKNGKTIDIIDKKAILK